MSFKKKIVIAIAVFGGGLLAFQSASPVTGQWMIDARPGERAPQLTLHGTSGSNGRFTSSSSLPLEQLRGLTRAQMDSSSGVSVRFEVVRDAGALSCEGYFKSGNGSGSFSFSPSNNFVSEMHSLGYSDLSSNKLFAMFLHDVSTAYVRDLNSLGLKPSSDQLIAMRIHGVAIDYVKGMKSVGYSDLSPDKLVAMRIHGVSTEFAKEMKALGYNATTDQLVAMRIHGVTTDLAKELKTQGYNPAIDQMVALRIHGASADFIKQVKSLGYSPTLDQLVAMRIHGVTPDYIRTINSRGVNKPTIDQLVSMRIHGIN